MELINLVYYCRHFGHVNTPKFGGFLLETPVELLETQDDRVRLHVVQYASLLDVNEQYHLVPLLCALIEQQFVSL